MLFFILDAAIEAGAEDCDQDGDSYQIITSADDLMQVKEVVSQKFGESESAELAFIPQNTVEVDLETAEKIV